MFWREHPLLSQTGDGVWVVGGGYLCFLRGWGEKEVMLASRYGSHRQRYGVVIVLQLRMIFIRLEFLIIVAVSCLRNNLTTRDPLSHGHARWVKASDLDSNRGNPKWAKEKICEKYETAETLVTTCVVFFFFFYGAGRPGQHSDSTHLCTL